MIDCKTNNSISNNELKLIQLDILKHVHSFCVDNNIRYTMAYGTLLGAVRHKGYIPWDNDIDIAMLRKDFERFIAEYKDETFVLYELRTDSDCDISYAKVYDNRTMLVEHLDSKNIGVNIDVFPIDDLYDDYNKSIKEFNSFRWYKIQKMIKGRKPSHLTTWWKRMIYWIGKKVMVGISLRGVCEIISQKAMKKRDEDSEYVSLLTGISLDYKSNIMHRNVYDSIELMKFEDTYFYGLKHFDEYLTICYGCDYMQLPPEEKRLEPHLLDDVYWK